eukprot:TRINITY_DN45858_c0_g1_i1.p2 TRINITY_DN45858_c0_g1~~TRINITY_DN45858_c0_g1_i1.p2  ORF type:complete len:192 (+),score=49.55 TRINITY_DN45858_c0_g1_i1:106-681(+)
MPGTNCGKAMQIWSEKNDNTPAEDAEVVKLLCMMPPIEKMDSTLNNLVNCKRLSLSTNKIDKMIPLPALKNLEILSLGRNCIKKIAGLEEVGATLQQLWLSYNLISTLDGLAPCSKLHTLFISNNQIKDWGELSKLNQNPAISSVLFTNNPIYDGLSKRQARAKVAEQVPKVASVDGEMLTGDDGGDEEEE